MQGLGYGLFSLDFTKPYFMKNLNLANLVVANLVVLLCTKIGPGLNQAFPTGSGQGLFQLYREQ